MPLNDPPILQVEVPYGATFKDQRSAWPEPRADQFQQQFLVGLIMNCR